jgi:hypothetical protein
MQGFAGRVVCVTRMAIRIPSIAAAGIVVAATATVPGIAAPVPHAVPAAAVRPQTADPAATASAAARSTGRPVEVPSLGSETTTVLANPDGTFRAEITPAPTRVRRGAVWVPVDTTLRAHAGGTVAPAAAPAGVAFTSGGAGPLATLSVGGWSAALSWPGALPAPTLSGDTAVYADVLPGVDLTVRAAAEGFSEQLVVRSRAAAADPRLAEVRFGLATTGLTFHSTADGGMDGVDAAGAAVVTVPAPSMWDASDQPARARVGMSLAGGQLALRPDLGLLAGASTRFPVTIDPSFNASQLNWAVVHAEYPSYAFWNGNGLTPDSNGNAMVGLDPYWIQPARSFFQMNTSPINGKHILSATFQVPEGWSSSCSAREVDLWETGGIGTSTTWNNQPSWMYAASSANVAHGHSSSCPAATVEFDATQPVRDAASRGWPNLTLGLRAANEGDTIAWKRFQPNASLAVVYNSIPGTPTALNVGTSGCVTGSGRPFIGTATPTLTATVTDPDHDLLNTTFSWGPVGGSVTGSTTQNSVASGSQAIVTVPAGQLADGSSYFFHVQTTDTIDSSPVSGTCEFTVDNLPPSAPPVVTSADYPNDGSFHGGVGQTGSFTLGAAGVPDITAYRYGWADPPTTQVAAPSPGAGVTISATPGAQGLNTLFVRSVDPAGNLSAITQYTFLAGGPAGPVGQWLMDEGSGTTLNDGSGNGNTATLSGGTSWTGGRAGGGDQAVAFDAGTGAAATAGPVLNTSHSFSVAAWVRLTDASRWYTAVSQDGVNASGFQLQYNFGDNNWQFNLPYADTPTPNVYDARSGFAPRLGVWTHLVGVYDAGAGTVSLYVNGVLAGTGAAPAVSWNASGPLTIGRSRWNDASTDWWSGGIDDVQVWNRVVYPAEIQAIADASTLEGQWMFDDGSGTTAADSSAFGRNLTLSGGVTWTTGFNGLGAVALDGSTGSLSAGVPVVLTDQSFTVAAWVLLNAAGGTETAVAQRGSQVDAFSLEYAPDANRWSFTLRASDTANAATARALSTGPPAVGTWTFLTGVYDAGTGRVKLYVDGQLQGTASQPALWNAGGPLTVGSGLTNGAQSGFWNGDIDNTYVYLGALSDADIVNLFNS